MAGVCESPGLREIAEFKQAVSLDIQLGSSKTSSTSSRSLVDQLDIDPVLRHRLPHFSCRQDY